MPKTIGFIGLGIMGKPMAKHLINAGYPLVVYNRTARKAQELVAMGARQANSPKEVAENSEIIITMVADSPEVEQVILGPAGVIEGAKPGSVISRHEFHFAHRHAENRCRAGEKECWMLRSAAERRNGLQRGEARSGEDGQECLQRPGQGAERSFRHLHTHRTDGRDESIRLLHFLAVPLHLALTRWATSIPGGRLSV